MKKFLTVLVGLCLLLGIFGGCDFRKPLTVKSMLDDTASLMAGLFPGMDGFSADDKNLSSHMIMHMELGTEGTELIPSLSLDMTGLTDRDSGLSKGSITVGMDDLSLPVDYVGDMLCLPDVDANAWISLSERMAERLPTDENVNPSPMDAAAFRKLMEALFPEGIEIQTSDFTACGREWADGRKVTGSLTVGRICEILNLSAEDLDLSADASFKAELDTADGKNASGARLTLSYAEDATLTLELLHADDRWDMELTAVVTDPDGEPLELTLHGERVQTPDGSEGKFEMPLPASLIAEDAEVEDVSLRFCYTETAFSKGFDMDAELALDFETMGVSMGFVFPFRMSYQATDDYAELEITADARLLGMYDLKLNMTGRVSLTDETVPPSEAENKNVLTDPEDLGRWTMSIFETYPQLAELFSDGEGESGGNTDNGDLPL